jgi:hypothetical protein
MRLILGLILGALLTVGGTYVYDSQTAANTANAQAEAQRPLVNWDVVDAKWQILTERARSEWHKHVASN